MAVVRGANAPLLQQTIRDQLEAERMVLAGGRERKVVRRPPRRQQTRGRAGGLPLLPLPLHCSWTCQLEASINASESSGRGQGSVQCPR